MLKQRPLQFIITIIPLVILLVISAYFAIVSWEKYQSNSRFQKRLENAKLLQQYEAVTLNETLCTILIKKDPSKALKNCDDRMTASVNIGKKLTHSGHDLIQWTQKIVTIKENIQKNKVENLEKTLGTNGIKSTVESYCNKTMNKIYNVKEKSLLHMYVELSNIVYATEVENFLLTYYVSKNIPVSTANIIFWDKIVEASYLFSVEEKSEALSSIKNKLLAIANDNTLQTVLSKIDDMRIAVLTGNMHKNSVNLEWIVLLEKKLDSLYKMQTIVYSGLNHEITEYKNSALQIFFLYILILFLAIGALFYSFIKRKKEEKENKALLAILNRINVLSTYGSTESKVMHKMLDDAKSKEDIFAYVYSSFQLLHEKCKQAKDEAESKSQFLSTLSHEIRTPLNGIIGFSKLLRDMGSSPDQEEFLSLIEGSSHKLIMIVNDILDLSKMNADKMEIENISFDISNMIESTGATFIQQTDQKDIELGIFVDPFLSSYFLGDATKLSQILTNLIGNAVKFTEPYGKINIFVQSMYDNDDEARIKFAVHDDGIGLSEEQIKNIFNAFSQATKGTSNKYGGTGLGLTISRKMVELMGGRLEVESEVNQGASFHFTLTLAKDKTQKFPSYPKFSNVHVGLALPVKNIKRQLDTNLETYMRHIGAEFSLFYYDDLFADDKFVELPDIMIFDHHYARLEGELEQCAALDCTSVLLTNGTLRSRIDLKKHQFNDVILRPISLRKSIRILNTTGLERKVYAKTSKKLENIESFLGLRALVADDNLINRKLIKIILEKIGLDVTLASDGKEAFEKYQEETFDIIFMDIQMPIMDGVDATHSIMKYERDNALEHVPIIALTANVGTGDKERYIAEGMDDYATKPVEIDTIKAVISKYCTN